MRRILGSALVLLGLLSPAFGQQVSESVNVMPVWVPCDLATDPDCASHPDWQNAWRYGDIFLQRQVEPSLAVSSRNPDHLLTAFIDYSAVEVADDQGLGETVAANWWGRVGQWLARLLWRSPAASEPRSLALGTGEAWIRLSWSVNGGATSTPFFLPGAPWDGSNAGRQAEFYQRATGASDPVVVAAPNGDFHVIFMAFRRGDVNFMMNARFRDLNTPDDPARHSLAFLGFSTLASGNNSTWGTLHDKPHALVVPDAGAPAGYALYVSFTLFNGNTGGGKFQSQLFVAKSVDGGVTFTTQKVNASTNENSGTSLAVTRTGEPIVFWRGFGSSPTIYYTKPQRNGWMKPASILGNTFPTLATFDQGNWKADPANLAGSEQNITPRSNAFPASAVGADGTIYVAWQECVNPATGYPLACASGGSPRIVLMYTRDDGATWLPQPRRAVDIGVRTPEANGLGYFFHVGRDDNNAHPQLMPSLSCGAGQCLLTYWESRTAALSPANRWIGGYHRLMDLRGAILDANGIVTRSFQISRYPYRPDTTLVTANGMRQEDVNDVDRVNEVCTGTGASRTCSCTAPAGAEPPLPGLEPGCIPRLNFYCRPQSGGGTTCFMGDYNALSPSVPFVRTPAGGWRRATSPAEVPWVGFLSVAADNRNLIPPASILPSQGGLGPTDQLSRFRDWMPGSAGLPACQAGGSRNTDAVLAKISLGLLVTTPVTAKASPSPGDEPFITFPLQAWNNSSQPRTVTFTITTPDTATTSSSFSRTAAVKSGSVQINAHSSTTRVVYAVGVAPIQVQVSDGTVTTTVAFNAAGADPSAGTTASSVTVSDPVNISAENISAENISAENISAENISAENISAENFGVQETTWLVQASGDPTRPYLALPFIDRSFSTDYDFRLVIYRLSSTGACVDGGSTTRQYHATVIANTGAANISAENISAENISAENGFPADPTLDNAVFIPKPGRADGNVAAQAAPSPDCSGVNGYRIGECVDATPPEPEFTVVKLIAIQKNPTDAILAAGRRLYSPTTAPAALTVSDYWCDENCQRYQKGPDLVVVTNPTAAPTTVRAGEPVQFPAGTVTVQNAGTLPAGPRRYGLYLSADRTLDLLPSGLVDAARDTLLGTVGLTDPLAAAGADSVPPQSVTIPAGTAPGTYYLILYADDRREVSELDETNNITDGVRAVEITVVAQAAFGFSGLFSPCSGSTCTRQGGGAVPLAWQFTNGTNPVDTLNTPPRLLFYRSDAAWNEGPLVAMANPGEVSTGNSDFQYCNAAQTFSLCQSRPAFTWQYNWERRDPATGATLNGNFLMWIEVPAVGQTRSAGTAIGPIRISLP